MPGIRIVTASMISIMIAEFVNSYLMAKLKLRRKSNSLGMRIFISCSFSFLLDLTVFLTLAFYGTMPNNALFQLICFAYLKKIICQIILFPVICYLIMMLKKAEGVEIYDFDTQFNPFSLDNVYDLYPERDKINNRYASSPIALQPF